MPDERPFTLRQVDQARRLVSTLVVEFGWSRSVSSRSRLSVNRQSPMLCEPLCNSGPVSGSAGNKERLLLRTAPKGNPRSTLFALPQPESRRGAQLRQVSAVIPPPGDREFESVFLQRRVRCEPASRGNSPSYVEKPRFSAGVRAGASGGRQRRAGHGNIGPTGGDISVGLYSSTARDCPRQPTRDGSGGEADRRTPFRRTGTKA